MIDTVLLLRFNSFTLFLSSIKNPMNRNTNLKSFPGACLVFKTISISFSYLK